MLHLRQMFDTHCLMKTTALLLAVLAFDARAHTVPSLSVDAMFSSDRGYELRVNLDPRLFLSETPASLPPVPIAWYRDQSPAELQKSQQRATEYLHRAITARFGGEAIVPPDFTFQPMDGATNMPLADDTQEVHFLATAKGAVPAGRNTFELVLANDAKVSMILINSMDGTMERRPSVVFPGETSRPYALAFPAEKKGAPTADASDPFVGKSEASPAPRTPPVTEKHAPDRLLLAAISGAIALVLVLVIRLVIRRRQ